MVTSQASSEGEGGHFVHFCKIYNLQVTELPREPFLSASFYLRISTFLFLKAEQKSGEREIKMIF